MDGVLAGQMGRVRRSCKDTYDLARVTGRAVHNPLEDLIDLCGEWQLPAIPRTDPYVQNYRIRLLPQVRDAKGSSGYGCAVLGLGILRSARRPKRDYWSRLR